MPSVIIPPTDVSPNTGTGNEVLSTSPTLVTPILGAATGTSLSLSGNLTAGGITGTAIGASSPSTGAFTTLSATGNLTVPEITGPTSLILNTTTGNFNVNVAAGADINLTQSNGNATWRMNPGQVMYYQSAEDATAGATTKQTPYLAFRGKYWDGAASQNRTFLMRMTTSTTAANNYLEFGQWDFAGEAVAHLFQDLRVKLNGTTDTTALDTGSLQTSGGASVKKALYVGGLANIAGNLTVSGTGGITAPLGSFLDGVNNDTHLRLGYDAGNMWTFGRNHTSGDLIIATTNGGTALTLSGTGAVATTLAGNLTVSGSGGITAVQSIVINNNQSNQNYPLTIQNSSLRSNSGSYSGLLIQTADAVNKLSGSLLLFTDPSASNRYLRIGAYDDGIGWAKVVTPGALQIDGNLTVSGATNSYQLNVLGRIQSKGAGNTSATYGLDLVDSAGFDNFWVRDDGEVYIRRNLTVSGAGDSSFVGNVGIGTPSPGSKLTVSGGHINIGTDTYSLTWGAGTAWISGSSASNYLTLNTSGAEKVRVDTNGNVGIGTTSPGAYKLNVQGDGLYSGNLTVSGAGTNTIGANSATNIIKGGDGGSGTSIVEFKDADGTTKAYVSGNGNLTVSGAGGVTLNSATPVAQFTVSSVNKFVLATGVSIGGSANDGILYNQASGNFLIYPSATLAATFSSTATTLAGNLTVSGDTALSNTVTAAAAVASTHKVTMVIGGVTYYLLATT